MSSPEVHLLFRAGGRVYAIPGMRVVEIRRHDQASEGSFVDLSSVMGGPAVTPTAQTCTVLVQRSNSQDVIGLVADEATDVVAFAREDLVAPPDFGPRVTTPWLVALARTSGSFAVVLDVDGLLAHAEGSR